MHKSLKIALTGHTAGTGLALINLLKEAGHDVHGFSRSNGFDLSVPGTIAKIVSSSKDCDIFINNAFCEWAQVDLLYAVFEDWRPQPRLIINMSSNSGDGTKDYVHKYAVIKAALDKASEQLNNVPESNCKVTNLRPGWINTPRVEALGIDGAKLACRDIAETVVFLINSRHIHVSNMTILPLNRA